jgi:hypothetical protein
MPILCIYKKRFAIESSFRMRNIVKAKTYSRNIVIRYLLTIVSFLLKNIWISLQWMFFSRVRQGPRTIDEDLFRFDFFRLFVWEGLRKKLKFVSFVSVLRSLGWSEVGYDWWLSKVHGGKFREVLSSVKKRKRISVMTSVVLPANFRAVVALCRLC